MTSATIALYTGLSIGGYSPQVEKGPFFDCVLVTLDLPNLISLDIRKYLRKGLIPCLLGYVVRENPSLTDRAIQIERNQSLCATW
jgi:hypothetical protein